MVIGNYGLIPLLRYYLAISAWLYQPPPQAPDTLIIESNVGAL